jgi:hypothetical protein
MGLHALWRGRVELRKERICGDRIRIFLGVERNGIANKNLDHRPDGTARTEPPAYAVA